MLIKTIIPILISGLLLSCALSAAPGGGLLADHTAGTTLNLQDQTIAITGGTVRGGNLLHSFQEFNVETGQAADFQAAPDTQHIISRVTGPNDSWIDGQIKSTTSSADLYLVNPNGIVMGKNASLDVKGAFHATTADYVTLADGQQVYADPDQGIILTVAAPDAFGFLDADVGQIQIEGSQLRVADGKDISLVGGTLMVESGAELQAVGGNIDLIAVDSAGELQLTQDQVHSTAALADITFIDSRVSVSNQADSTTLGRIRGQGARIKASGSFLLADNNSRIDATDYDGVALQAETIEFSDSYITTEVNSTGQGGSVRLHAIKQVELNKVYISMETYSDATNAGKSGDLEIAAPTIILAESIFSTATYGGGQTGSVRLKAIEQVMMRNSSIEMETGGTGTSGNLEITAPTIILLEDTEINAYTLDSGQGGSVWLKATEQVLMYNSSVDMGTSSDAADAGAGGNLEITAPTIILAEGVEIDASTSGRGWGGLVRLEATERIFINNSFIDIETSYRKTNAGRGGDLRVMAPMITLAENTQITAATLGRGNGGSVLITADDLIRLSGQSTRISSSSHSKGIAGPVLIWANHLTLVEGSRIESTSGFAYPGKGSPIFPRPEFAAQTIRINLRGVLRMSGGSQITTSTAGVGDAGDIRIGEQNRPTALYMADGAQITSGSESDAEGAGAAGRLVILTGEQIQMQGSSALTTESQNAGGGGIRVETPDLLHLQDSQITTSVQGGDGRGGDIQIDPVFVILENSQIQANAHGGAGGNITLVADYLLRSGASVIEASSTLSTSGEIDVQAVDVDAGSLQATTQIAPLNVAQWQPVPCSQRRGKTSRLVMAGYDAHPTAIDDVLSALPLYTGLQLQQPVPDDATGPVVPQARFMSPAKPLTIQHGYLLAAAGTDIGCSVL